ncbi:MAG: hypothetical protein ACRDKU_00370 [Gaiellaceae bacterium]
MIGGDAAPVFVFIHSPLVGPSTSRPVARELERRGRQVLVRRFSAPPTAQLPQWRYRIDAVRAATSKLSNPIVLVGTAAGAAVAGDRQSARRSRG